MEQALNSNSNSNNDHDVINALSIIQSLIQSFMLLSNQSRRLYRRHLSPNLIVVIVLLENPVRPESIERNKLKKKQQIHIADKQRIEDYPNDDNVSDIDEKFEQIYTSATKDLDLNGDDDVRLPDGDSSFNLDNVEFADASDKEDLPDAMTAYEADRLLSSRCVFNFIVCLCPFQFFNQNLLNVFSIILNVCTSLHVR